MELKVGMVARCLNSLYIRGMGRYVFELLRQSRCRDDLSWLLFGDDPRYPLATPEGIRAEKHVFSFRGDRFHLWEQVGLPIHSHGRDIDVVHCTEGTLSLWQPKPTVVTVHDTTAWDEEVTRTSEFLYWHHILPAAMNRCAAIVTISESSRNDILSKWPRLEPKLSVIPHGIADEYLATNSSSLPCGIAAEVADTPYVMYVGGPMARKRFSWAVEIIARASHPKLKLIACGFGDHARNKAIDELPFELRNRVIFPGFLSDDELIAVYKGSRAVLYPTLYEGFGFPAVEAQAAGVPVFFSALGSLQELIGPLAVVLPPYDIDAWVAALNETLCLDSETLGKKGAAAKQWARRYSWRKSFDEHLDVYRKVAGIGA